MAEAVVITRPYRQATDLAARLKAAGRTVVVFPLLDIAPLTDTTQLCDALGRLTEFSLVAFVSPNAIDATFAHLESWPPDVALAVMGEGSRRALARHGVTSDRFSITSPNDRRRADSETLLQALDIERLRHSKVLILRGESGRELLADALRAVGANVEQVAAYRRSAVALTPSRTVELATLLNSESSWVITSSEALKILVQDIGKVDPVHGVAKIQHKKIYVPHPRILDLAQSLGFRKVCLTDAGDDGLFSTLQSAL